MPRIHPSMRLVRIALPLCLVAACAVEPDPSTIEQEFRPPPGSDCPTWGCGMNTSWMGDNLWFHDLDGSGAEENEAGLRVVGFFAADGRQLKVDVDGDWLRGWPADGPAVEGDELEGAYFKIDHTPYPGKPAIRYILKIDGLESTSFWVGPAEPVAAYRFLWRAAEAEDWVDWTSMCQYVSGDEWEAINGMALIFDGERYDGAAKTVTLDKDSPWFNLSCAGTAPAKLHLNRHTTAGSTGGYDTTVGQRQALLKTITADYCGNGMAFTTDGVPLDYKDRAGLLPSFVTAPLDPSVHRSIDAIFDEDGAYCVGDPRFAWYRGGVEAEIIAECPGIRWCSAKDIKYWAWNGHVISANPVR